MAGPVLADVEDGVTAVAAASVNQYKTAILLTAGATWDAATDLDLEEASDEIIAARGSAASVDARLDAAHVAAGTLRLDVAHITKQAQVNVDSAAAGNGDLVRYEEFVHEHETDGDHGPGFLLAGYVGDDVITATGDTASRPDPEDVAAGALYWNTQTNQIERSNGVDTWTAVTGTISAANVTDLTDGGETALHSHAGQLTAEQKTDLTDGGTTTLHRHSNADYQVFNDMQVASPGSGEAGALTEYSYLDPGATAHHHKIRCSFDFEAGVKFLNLSGMARISADPSPHTCVVDLLVTDHDGTIATDHVHITTYGAGYENLKLALDISSLAYGPCSVEVLMTWTSDSASGATAYVKWVSIFASGA